MSSDLDPHVADLPAREEPPPRVSEDWLAVLLGGLILFVAVGAVLASRPSDSTARIADVDRRTRELAALERIGEISPEARKGAEGEIADAKKSLAPSPLSAWLATPGTWDSNPADAFEKKGKNVLPGIGGALIASLVAFALGVGLMGHNALRFAGGFLVVFLLALFAFVLTGQKVIEHYNLEYALWALLAGLVISNTVGTPAFVMPAARTEFYIKTGLVLLGAEVLFNKLLALGLPGVFVSWVVTPIVLVSTYLFGQHVLKMASRSLNMVISADMSVCGVSAAIATAAACKAKKEELSLAIGLSLTFTVVMMVVMPAIIRLVGMDEVVAGAWLGGTIDSTGAVAAAGGMIGDAALTTATTIKMIQNILIGVVAFCVAVYWVTYVERTPNAPRPGVGEVWRRFPKFVLGFVAASLAFSWLYATGTLGEAVVDSTIGATKTLRGWFFCLAFVSIGLETNFRELSRQMSGGKPLVLYLCGQALNLALSLAMAYLMFKVVFPDAAATLAN